MSERLTDDERALLADARSHRARGVGLRTGCPSCIDGIEKLTDALDAARARAEAAEAKLARVRELAYSETAQAVLFGVTGTHPESYGGVTRDEALECAGEALTDLRAALADPETEAVRNVPLGMPEPAGPDDLRPALEAQSVSNLYVCTCGHLRPAHAGSREDDFCCLETDCHCNGWNPA